MTDHPTDPFFEQLRQLVTEGDTALALEQLTALLNGQDDELRREALGHRGRLNALRREEREGILTPEAVAARRGPRPAARRSAPH
jgi:hypothetical protein